MKQYVEEVNFFSYLTYNTHKFCLELMENMLRAAAAALRVVTTD